MVIRLMYIIRDHIFKGQHPFCIHIPRARDQVLLIGILPGELEPDQMAPVIEPAAVHIVIILILQPVGFMELIFPRSSVGMVSSPTQASAVPQRQVHQARCIPQRPPSSVHNPQTPAGCH